MFDNTIPCRIAIFLLPAFCLFLPLVGAAELFPPATPDSQGVSSAALERLDLLLQTQVNQGSLIGLEFLVIKNRRTVHHTAMGWLDREDQRPMEKNTIFNIRSMTKPLTGAAAQVLIDEGTLHLDDPAANFLPGFDHGQAREITVEHLITHRSGLPLSLYQELDTYPDLLSLADAVGEAGPDFEPGSRFRYSDAGSEALGAIVEVASEQPLETFLYERLLQPMGMTDTFRTIPIEDPRWERMATIYFITPEGWIPIWKPAGEPFYPFSWGSQSLHGTPMDYAKFLAMWMDGGRSGGREILSPEAIQRSLTPVSPMLDLFATGPMPTGFPNAHTHYGQMSILYAFEENVDEAQPFCIGHSGSDGTFAWAWPDEDLMVLLFTQSRGSGSIVSFETFLHRELVRPGQAVTAPEPHAPYVGSYRASFLNPPLDEFVILVQNGLLSLSAPDTGVLDFQGPDSQGTWNLRVDPGTRISFLEDTAGNVAWLRLNQHGTILRLPRIQTTPVMEWRLLDGWRHQP